MPGFTVTSENYFSREAEWRYCTNSQLKRFMECPARWMQILLGEWVEIPSEAMFAGTYVDLAMTEPANFLQWVYENQKRIKTSAGKKKSTFVHLDAAMNVLRAEPKIMQYLKGDTQAVFAIDDFGGNGLRYKCKLDVLDLQRRIVDLKTTESLYRTQWSSRHKGHVGFLDFWLYWRQLALYRAAVKHVHGVTLPCYIVAIEKKPYYDRGLFYLDNERYLDQEARFAIEVMLTMQEIKEAGTPAEDMDRCERCDYCVSTKKILKPLSVQPAKLF